MVVRIYVSGISGNKEVKKRQQRVLMILDSKNVTYEVIDITEPGKEDDKEFMQNSSNSRDSKYPLPPQLYNEDDYCGDYEDFDLANEMDELEEFLKLETNVSSTAEIILDKSQQDVKENGNTSSREPSAEKEKKEEENTISNNEPRRSITETEKEEVEKPPEDSPAAKNEQEEEEAAAESADKESTENNEKADEINEEKSDEQEKEE